MKRFPIPPTKYDPMRPVQAKLAAPVGGPGAAIPPTRYGAAPVQARLVAVPEPMGRSSGFDHGRNHGAPIQRAAAPESVAAAASAATAAAGKDDKKQEKPTLADLFAGKLTAAVRTACLGRDCIIGSDWPTKSDVANELQKGQANCLAIWLKDQGLPYTRANNEAWMTKYMGLRRTFRVLGNAFYSAEELVKSPVKCGAVKNLPDRLNTEAEICILMKGGYVWHPDSKTFLPPAQAGGAH